MNQVLNHPPTGVDVVINSTSVEFALRQFQGRKEPIGVLKHIVGSLQLAWIETQNESENIQTMPNAERDTYLEKWTVFIDVGTQAIKAIMAFTDDITVTDKRSQRLAKLGISVQRLGWITVEAKEVKLREPCIDPKKGRLETIPRFKDLGKDNAETYTIFTLPTVSHNDARTLYQARHKVIGKDPGLSYITDSVGYQDGKMENVLQALKQHRTYAESEAKLPFRSHALNKDEPDALIGEMKEFITSKVTNPALKEMELDALNSVGPFDRYPIEYFKHKVAVSYEPKPTSFDDKTFANAWSAVARIVKDAIDASNRDVSRRMPGFKHLLFSPDPTQMSMLRKRDTSNAGFPTFGKFLDETEWAAFAKEVDAIMKNPSDFDPTTYAMIVGCRVVGKDLKVPTEYDHEDRFNYIREKNKQRVILMGSSVEFILGTKFTHPLFRAISTHSTEFAGLKSWNAVKGPLSIFFQKHKEGKEDPLSLAFGADASGFDASVTIQEWIMAKRLFQMVYPDYHDVMEFYFTMAAFSPTITLGKDRQPVVVEGCHGMASGVACTAVVDSFVQLARGIAVLMEVGIVPNELGARIPSGVATYVCGDDLGVVLTKSADNGKLTASDFCDRYTKYGGTAHPDKQLITTKDHPLGITLLFLKRLFSTDRKTVGWGTRLLCHALTGLVFTNPQDMTSSAKITSEFLKSGKNSELESEVYGLVALSDDAKLMFDGDLCLERRNFNHSVKKAAEANSRIRDVIRRVEAGGELNLEHFQRPGIFWPYRVTNAISLQWMLINGIINEEQMLNQLEEGAKLKLYDMGKMHLIKAVQQIEECHPHPLFKEFAEWILRKNPNFFNYDLLLGDEAKDIATYLRASEKGEGLGLWKIMPIIREHWVSRGHEDTTDLLTKAFIEKILESGDHMVNYLRSLQDCPSSPFDASLRTTRMLLERLYTHIGFCRQAKCLRGAEDMSLSRKYLQNLRILLTQARETGDRGQLSAVAEDAEHYADMLDGAYSALKHFAVTRDSVTEASAVAEPNDKC